jgi:hypothetical protein
MSKTNVLGDRPQAAAYTAGYKAYLLYINIFGNPYHDNRQHGLWINGFKRARRDTEGRDDPGWFRYER